MSTDSVDDLDEGKVQDFKTPQKSISYTFNINNNIGHIQVGNINVSDSPGSGIGPGAQVFGGQEKPIIKEKSVANTIVVNNDFDKLILFCKKQVQNETEIFFKPNDDFPFFDPDLYLPPRDLHKKFDEYLKSENNLFVIIGKPGVGKSSALYHLLQKYQGQYPSLFYNFQTRDGKIIEEIKLDFSFSNEFNLSQLIQYLLSLSSNSAGQLIIFVDDCDDASLERVQSSLSELLRLSKKVDNRLKLVLGVQPDTWNSLSKKKGSASKLALSSGMEGDSVEEKTRANFVISPLSNRELNEMLEIYRKRYCFEGNLSEFPKSLARFPFGLHLLAQTYKNQSFPIHVTGDELASKFVNAASQISGSEDQCRGAIDAVAASRIRAGEGRSTEKVNKIIIYRDKNFDKQELDAAIRSGILRQDEHDHGRKSIHFTNKWIEAYCIIFLVLELDLINLDRDNFGEKLNEKIGNWDSNPVLRWALNWYNDFAPNKISLWLLSVVERGADRYSQAWMRMLKLIPGISQHQKYVRTLVFSSQEILFPFFAEHFSSQKIKTVDWPNGRKSKTRVSSWDEVLLLFSINPSLKTLQFPSSPIVRDPLGTAFRTVWDRLESWDRSPSNIIELTTLHSLPLCQETAWAIIRTNSKKMDLPKRNATDGYSLEEAKRGMAIMRAKQHYDFLFTQKNQVKISFASTWTSTKYSGNDHKKILEDARSAVNRGKFFEKCPGMPSWVESLEKILESLENFNVLEIKPPIDINMLLNTRMYQVHGEMEDVEKFQNMISQIYLKSLEEYRKLIHHSFPGIADVFSIRVQKRFKIELEVTPHHAARRIQTRFKALYYEAEYDSVKSIILQNNPRMESQIDKVKAQFFWDQQLPDLHKKMKPFSWKSAYLYTLLEGSDAPEIDPQGQRSGGTSIAPIRGNVLRWLKEDLCRYEDKIKAHLREAAFDESQTDK